MFFFAMFLHEIAFSYPWGGIGKNDFHRIFMGIDFFDICFCNQNPMLIFHFDIKNVHFFCSKVLFSVASHLGVSSLIKNGNMKLNWHGHMCF